MSQRGKIIIGILLGINAGVINLIPFVSKNFEWSEIFSLLITWIIIGFLLPVTNLKVHPIMKGIIISTIVFLPSAVLFTFNNSLFLLGIFLSIVLLGGSIGYTMEKIISLD